MHVKTNTQTWSKAAQQSSLKAESGNTLSAQDAEKVLGDQNLGEYLNKIADPNWVDPAKARRVGNTELDKDAFMKLMLTQMKNQDPTNPMQSHEMAAQLAQFTSLEQLTNINTTLSGMKSQQSPSTNYQALNFIGKKVAGDSSKILRVAGDKHHEFNFELAGDASNVAVKVKDLDGNVVRELKASNLKKGANKITWNGLDTGDQPARPGEYRMSVEATASNGGKVFARTEFDGKITGLNFTNEGPVLMVGTQTVRMQDVKRIYEPSPEERMMEAAPAVPLDATGAPAAAKGAATKAPLEDVPAASDDAPAASRVGKDLAMARGLMNVLAKQSAASGAGGSGTTGGNKESAGNSGQDNNG